MSKVLSGVSLFPQEDDEQGLPPLGTAPSTRKALLGAPLFPEDPADPLHRSMTAPQPPPDTAARIERMQLKTGLPRPIIERNLDAIERRTTAADFDPERMRKETPYLAQYLSDPANTALSQDDHQQLGAMEHLLNFAKNSVRSLAAALPSTNAGIWGALQAPADLLSEYIGAPAFGGADPFVEMAQYFEDRRRDAEIFAKQFRGEQAGAGFTEKAVYSGIESLGQNALMLIPAILSGGSAEAFMLGSMGTVAGGQAYGQAKDQGVDTVIATQFALAQGLIEVATEKIPVSTLLQSLGGKVGFTKLLGQELFQELRGEEIATVLQDLNEWAVLPENGKKTFRDYMEERPSAAAATAIATIVGTVGQVGITRVVDRAFLPSLGKAVEQSKTFERMPEKVREFIANAAKDTPVEHVYLDPQDVKQFFQDQKQDPAAFMEQLTPDGRAKYEQALQTGAPIEIPLADYATKVANTDHATFFNNVARLGSPETMNEREKQDFRKQLEQESAQQPAESVQDPAAQIREDIIGQMVHTGFDRTAVEAYATLYSSAFRTMGERSGQDPLQLYEQYKLKINRPLPEVLAAMGEINAFDSLLDRLRSNDVPTGRDVSGASLIEFIKEQGGVIDEGGELKALEVDKERKAFTKGLIQKKGLPLDRARELAAEVGYLPKDSSIADFLNRIEQEARGTPVYSTQFEADPQKLEQQTMLNQLADYLKALGVDLRTATNEDVKRILSEAAIEPKSGQVLNQQQTLEGPRGQIRMGPNREMSIELLEKADLSTFLHESGHFFLETFGDTVDELLARSGDLDPTQQKMVDDYGKLLQWLDVADRSMIGTEQHEQWARGFEAYLREGKAPNGELRSAFARFRSWLISIYQSLKQLRVQLTPEVRGVMDRLLATDEQITAAEQQAHVEALFTDAQSAGMSEKEFGAYRDTVQQASDRARDKLQRELMDEYNRERESWWTAQREIVHDQVAAEVQGQRDYIALAFFQKGTLPDGSPLPDGVQPVKLSREALVEQYGKEFLKRLPRPYVYSKEGGVAPQMAADLFGYSSGDELVQALINARPMKALIEAETDSRMRERYGDMLLDGSLPDKARQAVMTTGRSEVIAAEMKALAKKQREVRPFLEAREAQTREGVAALKSTPSVAVVRSWALARVQGMTVRDLRPNTYWTAARQAGRQAFEAAARGDYDVALLEKRKELLNVELYRAVTEARDQINKSVDYLRSFQETKKRERIGKAGADYLDQIDGLLDRFDLAKISQKAANRRASLADWIAEQERQGLPVEITVEVRNEARRQNYQTMTVEQLQGLSDSVKMIEHLARLKNKLLKAKEQRELEATVTAMTSSIRQHGGGKRPSAIETRLPGDAGARRLAQFFASHRKLHSFLREMDGFEDGGVMWESIMRPINEAADEETVRNEKATQALDAIFKEAYRGEESSLYRKTFIPAINNSLSKMGRLVVAMNWGNAENRQRLLNDPVRKWNESQVQAILETLDERDWTFVQAVYDHIDSYWSEIAAKEKRVTGVAPEKVEALSIQTRFGEFRGGYFPIAYEGQLSARASSNLEAAFADSIRQASYVSATTQRGHTKARLEKVSQPLRLDFDVIFGHINQVNHDLSHHEMLIDVGRLLGNRQAQEAIYAEHGDIVYDNIKGAIRDIALGNAPAPDWYRFLNSARQGVVTASLAWNAFTSVLQPFQLSNSMARIGPKWVIKGTYRWLRDAASMENSVKAVHAQSDFMRTRHNTQIREINELRNQVGMNTGRVQAWVNDRLHDFHLDIVQASVFADSYFYFIQKAQQIADIPTWLGAYEKAMAETTTDEATAIRLADQAVIDSQGSGHIKDLASVERGPVSKVFTTFYSYQNLLLNQTTEALKKANVKDPVEAGRLAVDIGLLLVTPAVVSYALKGALLGGGDDDGWLLGLIKEEAAQLAGLFIGVREFAGLAEGRDYTGPASFRAVSIGYQFGKQISQGELDQALARSATQAAGVVFHFPATQVRRTAEGVAALWEGTTRNPAAILFGPPPAP